MKNTAVVEKINKEFSGQDGSIKIFNNDERIAIGKFLGGRFKNESIVIFDFSEKSIGLFVPICVFSVVKKETADGFEGGDICKDFFIGENEFWEIIGKIEEKGEVV
jgi:hypothetical protein